MNYIQGDRNLINYISVGKFRSDIFVSRKVYFFHSTAVKHGNLLVGGGLGNIYVQLYLLL